MVVQTHRGQRRIPAWTQDGAATAEAVVLAYLPAIAEHHNRRGTVIETVAPEVSDRFLRGKRPALKALTLVKGDLCGRLRGNRHAGHHQRDPESCIHC